MQNKNFPYFANVCEYDENRDIKCLSCLKTTCVCITEKDFDFCPRCGIKFVGLFPKVNPRWHHLQSPNLPKLIYRIDTYARKATKDNPVLEITKDCPEFYSWQHFYDFELPIPAHHEWGNYVRKSFLRNVNYSIQRLLPKVKTLRIIVLNNKEQTKAIKFLSGEDKPEEFYNPTWCSG